MLNGIYGSSPSDIYIVGSDFQINYVIFHFDGISWNLEMTGQGYLNAVWASPSGFVAAVGGRDGDNYLIVTKEEDVWGERLINANPIGSYPDYALYSVWGSSDDTVYAVGGELFTPYTKSDLFRFSSGDWELMHAPLLEKVKLTKLSGVSYSDVYAIGHLTYDPYQILLLHYDGISWVKTLITSSIDVAWPAALWVAGPDSVFVSINEYNNIHSQFMYFNGNGWKTLATAARAPGSIWGFAIP